MINHQSIEVSLANLNGSEALFIDSNSGKVAGTIISTFITRACELTDASGYVHKLPVNCEFKFVSRSELPPPLPSSFSIPPAEEPETVADEVVAAPAVYQRGPDKKSIAAHFNKAVDGQSYKATIFNKYAKPTEVSFKFIGEVGIAWPYTHSSFEQGDLIIDARR